MKDKSALAVLKSLLAAVLILVMAISMTRLMIVALPYFICGAQEVMSGVLRGMGASMVSMAVSLVGCCLFRVIWIYTVFAKYHTMSILYLIHPITWIVTTLSLVICFAIYYKKEKKRFGLIE